MPNYNYYCSACDFNHVDLRTYEERNTPSECPECGMKGCPMTFDNSKNREGESKGVLLKGLSTPIFYHKVGTGNKKHEEDWMQGEIDNTKEVLKNANEGVSPYTPHAIPYEELEKAGVMKRVDKKTAKLRKKASENMARRAADNLSEKDYEYMGKNKKK